MKTLLLVVCIFCASMALGQAVGGASSMSNQPVVFQFESHEQRASQHSMGEHQTVLEHYASVSAHGVRPLWEVAPLSTEVPLGDTARMLQKEHASKKKAQVIWEN